MNRLILVRHGETTWNATKRFQGQVDTELSETGRWQASRTGDHLKSEAIDFVYCSDLVRCIETARLILAGRSKDNAVPIIPRPDLRELSFGDWEGLTYEEISARSPGVLERMRQDVTGFYSPGGERWMDMRVRVSAAFAEINGKHDGSTILIVSHINPLRVILGDALGTTLKGMFRFPLRNCSISIVNVGQDGSKLVLFNDTCHLEAEKAV